MNKIRARLHFLSHPKSSGGNNLKTSDQQAKTDPLIPEQRNAMSHFPAWWNRPKIMVQTSPRKTLRTIRLAMWRQRICIIVMEERGRAFDSLKKIKCRKSIDLGARFCEEWQQVIQHRNMHSCAYYLSSCIDAVQTYNVSRALANMRTCEHATYNTI